MYKKISEFDEFYYSNRGAIKCDLSSAKYMSKSNEIHLEGVLRGNENLEVILVIQPKDEDVFESLSKGVQKEKIDLNGEELEMQGRVIRVEEKT